MVASAHTPHIRYCTLLDNGYVSLDLYYDEAKEIITNREDILLVVDFLSDEGNEEVAEVAKVIAYRIKEDVIYLHTIIRGVGYELRCTPDSEGVWTTSITVAQLGDIEYALERIIELQNSLIGGDGV